MIFNLSQLFSFLILIKIITVMGSRVFSRLLVSKRAKIKKEYNITHYFPNVFNASNVYACNHNNINCIKVEEFEIDSDYENNCFEDYLQIYFKVYLNNNVIGVSHGYLHPNGINIDDSQKSSRICKRIKRYFVS